MDIETRLAELELRQRNRPWWALAGFAASLTLGAMLGAAGGSVPKEVRARAFVLEGPDGRVLSKWSYDAPRGDEEGQVHLVFYDRSGSPRIGLDCLDDGFAEVGVWDGTTGRRAMMMIPQNGPPQFIVKNKDGEDIFTRP